MPHPETTEQQEREAPITSRTRIQGIHTQAKRPRQAAGQQTPDPQAIGRPRTIKMELPRQSGQPGRPGNQPGQSIVPTSIPSIVPSPNALRAIRIPIRRPCTIVVELIAPDMSSVPNAMNTIKLEGSGTGTIPVDLAAQLGGAQWRVSVVSESN